MLFETPQLWKARGGRLRPAEVGSFNSRLFCFPRREKRKMGMTPGEVELSELECYRTKDKGIREAKEKQLAEILLARVEDMQ